MGKLIKIIWIILAFTNLLNAKVTPSEVFIEAKVIKLSLANQVTKIKGVSLLPVIDIDLQGATPSSVYALGSSLNMKLMIYALANNKPWENISFPNTKIDPKQVQEMLLVIKKNIKNIFKVNSFVKITAQNKKPADVAIELTYANQWLDKIMPNVKPKYPLSILERTENFIDKLLENKNIKFSDDINPKKYPEIKPKDVFINVTATYNLLRNLKKISDNETSASHPYNILSATNKVLPLDVFSLSVFNLYYLYSIGLNNFDSTKKLHIKTKISPSDVYKQATRVNYKLALLLTVKGE